MTNTTKPQTTTDAGLEVMFSDASDDVAFCDGCDELVAVVLLEESDDHEFHLCPDCR